MNLKTAWEKVKKWQKLKTEWKDVILLALLVLLLTGCATETPPDTDGDTVPAGEKIWVTKRPRQCPEIITTPNPDISSFPYDFVLPVLHENGIPKTVTIFDIKTIDVFDIAAMCEGCDCLRTYALYLLVEKKDLVVLQEIGYRETTYVTDCDTDDDCVKARGECCGCNAGGEATAVNKEHKDLWEGQWPPGHCACVGVMSSHWTCFAIPKCVNNRCELVNQTPEETGPYEGDYCETDDDCEIKDVHNCCGYFPRCVNKDYTPNITAVQRECEEKGLLSVCGWPDITHCLCINHTCTSMQGDSVI